VDAELRRPMPASVVASTTSGERTTRRISWLTPTLGIAAAAAACAATRRDWALGLLVGAALSWLNFRWLKRGLDALVISSVAQQNRQRPRVPLSAYFAALFRYGLLALGVYVIFEYLNVPLVSLVVGLCALGAAAITASVWEILIPPGTRKKG
jgi:small-conductance mechanosensitive channel